MPPRKWRAGWGRGGTMGVEVPEMSFLSQCDLCSRTNPIGTGCAAFPDGVPFEVSMNEVDHRFPVDGDHGFRFDPKVPFAEKAQASMFDEDPK